MKRKIITCIAFFLFAACILPQAAFASTNSKSYTKTPTYGQGYFDGKKAGYDEGYSDGYNDGEEYMKEQILSDAEQTIREEVSATKLESYLISSLAWVSIIVISVSIYKSGIDFKCIFKNIGHLLGKTKKIFMCVLITLVIWIIARLIPGIVEVLLPEIFVLKLFAMIVMLPVGWFAAKAVSHGKFDKCIRVNLYVFIFIEASGMISLLTYLLRDISILTERYTYGPNGIEYTDYPSLFAISILFEVAYIAFCVYLANKTIRKNNESIDSQCPPEF